MYYYAISDIHGYLDILQKTMKQIDLTNPENKLFLLGDYIDYGPDSLQTLLYIYELTQKYPSQVIALMGNHEESLLDWLHSPLSSTYPFQNFLTLSQMQDLPLRDPAKTNLLAAKILQESHKELIYWLRHLPLYYQTEDQIFVHAGIDEEAGDLWKVGTPKEYFTSKYPAQQGSFLKDIVAGHIGTSTLHKDSNCHEVYWDKKSHYYIDGSTSVSGFIPILKYDTITKRYSSFRKVQIKWQEYSIS